MTYKAYLCLIKCFAIPWCKWPHIIFSITEVTNTFTEIRYIRKRRADEFPILTRKWEIQSQDLIFSPLIRH